MALTFRYSLRLSPSTVPPLRSRGEEVIVRLDLFIQIETFSRHSLLLRSGFFTINFSYLPLRSVVAKVTQVNRRFAVYGFVSMFKARNDREIP